GNKAPALGEEPIDVRKVDSVVQYLSLGKGVRHDRRRLGHGAGPPDARWVHQADCALTAAGAVLFAPLVRNDRRLSRLYRRQRGARARAARNGHGRRAPVEPTGQGGQDGYRPIDHLPLDLLVVGVVTVRRSGALEPGGHLALVPWRDRGQLGDAAGDRELEARGQQSRRPDGRARGRIQLPDLAATTKHGEVRRD